MAKEKVVLAYSGGLDTSVMIPWLKEHYNCDVIAMCSNLGQADELDGLEEKALKTGASKVFIEDGREEFITDYIYPTLQAGAIYERKYLLGTSFGRPLIAKRQVEIAQQEGATMVAHGATGKGNDQVRFELTYMALDPSLRIIAPWKDDKWDLNSREDCIAYAEKHHIPITQSKKRIYSEDRNIWHISHEGGPLEDPALAPGDDVYTLSNTVEKAPDQAELITITFNKGIPTHINGQAMNPIDLLTTLNKFGSKHAIGQIDMVENRLVGIKSRGVYETPGGAIMYEAHQTLEQLVLDRSTLAIKQKLALDYADLVYDGLWFSPAKKALDGFVKETQKVVSGDVKLKLYKGNIIAAGVTSPHSLYVEDLASFSDTELYNQADATGFIKLYGLPLRVNGMVKRNEK
ncbi:MAG: argininosuccinate synthase [Rickettsiales bacterium]|nr:argininosuccinate synthase [Rickettsiales bacterium]|tara:strand:+ start:1801 stop:3012 length:1212 start_codon:yes stop_codon:yes gene_type:complete